MMNRWKLYRGKMHIDDNGPYVRHDDFTGLILTDIPGEKPCLACVARDKYIKLLEDELNGLAGYLHCHGIKFQRLTQFEKARDEIKKADN